MAAESSSICSVISNGITQRGILRGIGLEVRDIRWFPADTAQGVAGIAFLTNRNGVEFSAIIKISNQISWELIAESMVADSIGRIYWCPNFSLGYGIVSTFASTCQSSSLQKKNVFSDESRKYLIDTFFMEMIPGGTSLYHYIKSKEGSPEFHGILHSTTIQILGALGSAGEKIKFTHNDLHHKNVMVLEAPSEESEIIMYGVKQESGEYEYVATPSYGIIPVIIDYGASYSSAYQGLPWYGLTNDATLESAGFYPLEYNPFMDLIRFMFWCGKYDAVEKSPLSDVVFTATVNLEDTVGEGGWPNDTNRENPVNTLDIFIEMIRDFQSADYYRMLVFRAHRIIPIISSLFSIFINYPPSQQSEQDMPTKEDVDYVLSSLSALKDEYIHPSGWKSEEYAYLIKQLFEAINNIDSVKYFSLVAIPPNGEQIPGADLAMQLLETPRFVESVRKMGGYMEGKIAKNFNAKKEFYRDLQMSVAERYRSIPSVLNYLSEVTEFPGETHKVTVVDPVRNGSYTFEYNGEIPSGRPGNTLLREQYENAIESGTAFQCGHDLSHRFRDCAEKLPNCYETDADFVDCDNAIMNTSEYVRDFR